MPPDHGCGCSGARSFESSSLAHENGIESTADFAFWFTNYEEALQEAGRAVANAWEIARKTSEPGIAGLVRRIFEAERAGQVEAIPVPSQSLRIKPTRAKRALSAPVPGRRSGYEKEVQPSMLWMRR